MKDRWNNYVIQVKIMVDFSKCVASSHYQLACIRNIATSLPVIGSLRVAQYFRLRETGNDLAVHFPTSRSLLNDTSQLFSCSCDVLFGSVFLNLDWNFKFWRVALYVFRVCVCVWRRQRPVCMCVSGVCVSPGMWVTMFYLLWLTVFCRLQYISGIFRGVKDLCSWWESNRDRVRNTER